MPEGEGSVALHQAGRACAWPEPPHGTVRRHSRRNALHDGATMAATGIGRSALACRISRDGSSPFPRVADVEVPVEGPPRKGRDGPSDMVPASDMGSGSDGPSDTGSEPRASEARWSGVAQHARQECPHWPSPPAGLSGPSRPESPYGPTPLAELPMTRRPRTLMWRPVRHGPVGSGRPEAARRGARGRVLAATRSSPGRPSSERRHRSPTRLGAYSAIFRSPRP